MRKYLLFCIMFLVSMMCGCSDLSIDENNSKTSYLKNETAIIDHYNVTMSNYIVSEMWNDLNPNNGQYLIVTFKIKNNSKEDKIINLNKTYELYIDGNLYKNMNQEQNINISSNDEITHNLVYDVPILNTYDVLFYSGVVGNNMNFKIVL